MPCSCGCLPVLVTGNKNQRIAALFCAVEVSLSPLHPYELLLCLHVADAQWTSLSDLNNQGMTLLLNVATLTAGGHSEEQQRQGVLSGLHIRDPAGTSDALFLFLCRLTFHDSLLVLWQDSPLPLKVGFAAWRAQWTDSIGWLWSVWEASQSLRFGLFNWSWMF